MQQQIDTESIVRIADDLKRWATSADSTQVARVSPRIIAILTEAIFSVLQELQSPRYPETPPPVSVADGHVQIDSNAMVPNQVYESATSQGPMQFVKGADGVVKVYEIYDVDELETSE